MIFVCWTLAFGKLASDTRNSPTLPTREQNLLKAKNQLQSALPLFNHLARGDHWAFESEIFWQLRAGLEWDCGDLHRVCFQKDL